MADEELLREFVSTFAKLDDCWRLHSEPLPDELNAGIDPEDWSQVLWRPTPIQTDPAALEPIYARLPAPFPPLYERLVLSYRWLEVFLGDVCLFENGPGSALDGLAGEIFRDPSFVKHLIGQGYVPFARNADLYDSLCFDTNHPNAQADYPIVRFEHEAFLCYERIGESWVLWPSFRSFVIHTISAASEKA